MTFITFDIIGDLAFGKSFDCVKEGISHPWVDRLLDFMRNVAYLAALSYLPTPIFKMIVSTLQYFLLEDLLKGKEFVERRMASRLEQGTSRKDFVSPVLELVSHRRNTFKQSD